ncbi:alpha/beta fold hydrolase [Streptomyces sp. ODS05-4]|uniref:alpha/beta fold hydrolase n=1 Tax=Streptomyces sp. ODS05-4 TaxID=2944939 RepID=UPI00210C4BA2|nr:alpha/beta hydrolase [Streptomyces sp. ODS05-4]
MPDIVRPDGARIHYEVSGAGQPVLLLAPGGADSAIAAWEANFYHPVTELAPHFRVIAMDQRHSGRSAAPFLPATYEQTAADQTAVLDETGADRVHVVAAGLGCLHALRLAAEAPERIASVVLQEPPGRGDGNSLADFFGLFDEAMRLPRAASFDDPETEGLAAVAAAARADGDFGRNPAAGPFARRLHDDPESHKELFALRRERYITTLVRHRDHLFPAGSAYFSVPEESIAAFPAPLLVLPGGGGRQPAAVARRIAAEAPSARLLDAGFDAPGRRRETVAAVVAFLREHSESTTVRVPENAEN